MNLLVPLFKLLSDTGLIYGISNIYFATLLYLRINYFPFRDEPKDMRERKIFHDFEKHIYDPFFFSYPNDNKYGDKFIGDYLFIGLMNNVFTMFLSMMLYMVLAFKLYMESIALIPLLIFMHLILFPDYINKYFTHDIRTQRGIQLIYSIGGSALMISIFSLVLLLGDKI